MIKRTFRSFRKIYYLFNSGIFVSVFVKKFPRRLDNFSFCGILFPSGTYFFPYIFTEISGGVIFALFFYRAKITNLRIILARFAVTVITNLLIDPTITYYYYLFYLGKSYTFFSIPRIIKNLALFPLQCLLLIIFLNVVIPITNRFGYTYMGKVSLKPEKKDYIIIAVLTVVSAICVVLYYIYKGVITF